MFSTNDEAILPKDWRAQFSVTRARGDAWLRDGASVLLRVPSAIVPAASNALMNPTHADAKRFSIVSIARAPFDWRLI